MPPWAKDIKGFVTRAQDVPHLSSPQEMFRGLALNYEGTRFSLDDETIGMLRWSVDTDDKYQIPFGGVTEEGVSKMQGTIMQKDPFTGNGFTKSDSYLVPEFKVEKDFPIPHGTELYILTRSGEEKIIGIYDGLAGRFKPIK